MSRWYRASTWYKPDVEEVEADRVTEKSIWIDGRRNNIEGRYHTYFSERADAVQHVIDFYRLKVRSAESRLEYCRDELLKAIDLGDG